VTPCRAATGGGPGAHSPERGHAPPPMIILKISNSSEFIASRIGKFLESLTPDSFDETRVEDILLKKLAENLSEQGFQGEVAAVRGVDLQESSLVISESMQVRRHQQF
jgi:hypothetical protein